MMTKEERKKYDAKYRETHKEQIKNRSRKYNQTHKRHIKAQKKEYDKNYYQTHKKQIGKYNKKYHQEHLELYRKYGRNHGRKLRLEVLKKLGNKCVRCGFSDIRALQIDHVHSGGLKELREISSKRKYYEKVLTDQNGNYQLLCANCNWIKKDENGENRKW